MIRLRRNLFETNSSATHGFVFGKGDEFMIDLGFITVDELQSGKIEISTIDVTTITRTNDVRRKMSYVFTAIVDGRVSIHDLPMDRCLQLFELSNTIERYTGLTVIYDFNYTDEYDNLSTDIRTFIFRKNDKTLLRNFLFHEQSVVSDVMYEHIVSR